MSLSVPVETLLLSFSTLHAGSGAAIFCNKGLLFTFFLSNMHTEVYRAFEM